MNDSIDDKPAQNLSTEDTPDLSAEDSSDLREALARLSRIESELLVLAAAERDKERGLRPGVKLAQFVETNWMVRLVTFGVSAIVLAIGAWGVMIYAEERQARTEERLARAWQNLATPAVGNSGKGAAINHLSNAGIELDHLDLSCDAMGGLGINPHAFPQDPRPDFHDERCVRPPVLSGIALSARKATSMNYVDFSNTEIKDSSFEGVRFAEADMTATRVSESQFNQALFCNIYWGYSNLNTVQFINLGSDCAGGSTGIQFPGSRLTNVSATDSDLGGTCFSSALIVESKFERSDLSGSSFFQTTFHDGVSFKSSNLTDTNWLHWTSPVWSGTYLHPDFIRDAYFADPESQTVDGIGLFDHDRRYGTRIDDGTINLGCGVDLEHNASREEVLAVFDTLRDALDTPTAPDTGSLDYAYLVATQAKGIKRFADVDFRDTFVTHYLSESSEIPGALEKISGLMSSTQAAIKKGDQSALADLFEGTDAFLGNPEAASQDNDTVLMVDAYFPEIIPGLPAQIAPQWICLSDDGQDLFGQARRPPQENCVENPWFESPFANGVSKD